MFILPFAGKQGRWGVRSARRCSSSALARSPRMAVLLGGRLSPDNPDEPDEPGRRDPSPRRSPSIPVPQVATDQGTLDIYSRLAKDRKLLLGTQVNDEVCNQLVAQMLFLAQEKPDEDITLYINSPGGSVSAGLALYDTMNYVPCDVATVAGDSVRAGSDQPRHGAADGQVGERDRAGHGPRLFHECERGGGVWSDRRGGQDEEHVAVSGQAQFGVLEEAGEWGNGKLRESECACAR
eukprot:ctg_1768.g390